MYSAVLSHRLEELRYSVSTFGARFPERSLVYASGAPNSFHPTHASRTERTGSFAHAGLRQRKQVVLERAGVAGIRGSFSDKTLIIVMRLLRLTSRRLHRSLTLVGINSNEHYRNVAVSGRYSAIDRAPRLLRAIKSMGRPYTFTARFLRSIRRTLKLTSEREDH